MGAAQELPRMKGVAMVVSKLPRMIVTKISSS